MRAEQVSNGDIYHFSRRFPQRMGMSPTAYRCS
jgi:AraC-like DNA-binding protein